MSRTQLANSNARYGWVVVAVCSLLMGMASGAMASFSVFLVPLTLDFGWQRGDTAFAYTAAATALGLSGIGMGYLADRFFARPVAMAGAIGLGVSLLLLGQQNALWQLYLFSLLLGGLGAAALDAPLLATVGNWFSANKGLALGIATAGRALGQGLVPYAAGYLISTSGWRAAYTILGLASLAALVPLTFLVRSPGSLTEGKSAPEKQAPSGFQETYPIPTMVLIPWMSTAVAFCCACMASALMHVVAMARDAGIEERSAAGILTTIYLFAFIGRIPFGKLADHIGSIRAYLLASAAQTALVFWFTQMRSFTGFTLLAILFGLGYSGVMTCFIICVREMVPTNRRGVSVGIVMFFAWAGMGLGGYQAGHFFDITGNYTLSYANAVAAGAINLVIVGSLLHYVTRKQAAFAVEQKPA